MRPSRRALLGAVASASVLGTAATAVRPDAVREPPGERPRTGPLAERAPAFADQVDGYLAEHDVPGAGVAIAFEGGPVLAGGVGWHSPAAERPVQPDSLARIASLSKPLTAAAVRRLARAGHVSLEDAVRPLLPVEAPGGAPADPRFADITLGHLLAHRGGWDRRESFDPMLHPVRVARELGVDPPPEERDVARYLLGRDLDFAPGSETAYANVGYLLLGLAIETVSGREYQAFLRETVLAAAGVDPSNLRLGRTRPADRPSREVAYAARRYCRDAFGSHPLRRVPCPDGGFAIEPMAAHGGHVATAGAYARVFRAYDSRGEPRARAVPDVARGTLPGTISLAFHDWRGRTGVVLCNRRTDDPGGLRSVVRRGLAAVDPPEG